MRRLRSVGEANALMQSRGLPNMRPIGAGPAIRPAGARPLGDYGESDPNTGHHPGYSESQVFRSEVNPEGQTQRFVQEAPVIRNRNAFTMYPFSIFNTPVYILPSNERRNFLLIQNQSAASDLYFNLSGDAGVNVGVLLVPGAGVFFDVVCPYNGLSIIMDSATNEPGCVVEGAPVS